MTTQTPNQAPPGGDFEEPPIDPRVLSEAYATGGEAGIREAILAHKIGAVVRAAYAAGGEKGVAETIQRRTEDAYARHGERAFADGAAAWFDMAPSNGSNGHASARPQPGTAGQPRQEARQRPPETGQPAGAGRAAPGPDSSPQSSQRPSAPGRPQAERTRQQPPRPPRQEETRRPEGRPADREQQTRQPRQAPAPHAAHVHGRFQGTHTTVRDKVNGARGPAWAPEPGRPRHTEVFDAQADIQRRRAKGRQGPEYPRFYQPRVVRPEVFKQWNTETTIDDSEMRCVGKNEAEDIFERAELRGDRKFFAATQDLLKEAGLLPHHRLIVEEDRAIWFSKAFDIDDRGRAAIIGYVETDDGKIVARSYYRSQSSGAWRYLPQYRYNLDDERVDWYGKGYGEESLTLPAVLQEGLTHAVDADGGLIRLDEKTREAAFYGTTRDIKSEGTVYYRSVSRAPRDIRGMPHKDDKRAPEDLIISLEHAPRFDKRPMRSWTMDTSLYGRVECEVFHSENGQLGYSFCRDKRGRAWISSIEDLASHVESTGLRTEWISSVLTTPAYEYSTQARGYGNDNDRDGHYVDMFENYLSKIPVIKDYVRSKSQRR